MKKLLVLSAILVVILCIALFGGAVAFAEEPEYPCKVVENIDGYGNILYDIESGNVGDIVTLIAKPYVFCKIDSIQVNGTDLVADEDGNYKFALVEGDNNITAKFILDPEQMGALKEYVAQAQEEGLSSLFTLNNLFNLLSWIFTMIFGSGFIVTLIKQKMIKQKTADNVKEAVLEALNSGLAQYCGDLFTPIVNAIDVKLNSVADITKTLARCMVISQENTPEARLAIIEELTKLQTSSNELAEQVMAMIKEEVDKKTAEKQAQQDAIKELEEQNEAIQVEEMEVKADSYGQM